MKIVRRKTDRKSPARWLDKALETAIKASILLSYPIPVAVIVSAIWYYILFPREIHFNEGLRDIATAAWIPIFGILYALLAAVVLNTVWSEYKAIRMSIKNYDIITFMNLRDEDVSPLVHVMMAVFSWAVLLAFMGLKYPDATSGVVCIASTAYLFGLIFFVVMEIDNPLAGIWFIKTVHNEWIEMDVKQWRNEHWDQMKKRGDIKPIRKKTA